MIMEKESIQITNETPVVWMKVPYKGVITTFFAATEKEEPSRQKSISK